MELIPRPYQQRVFDAIIEKAKSGFKRILVVLPTGGGKSHIQAMLAKSSLEKGNTVLSLVHRRGLVEQMHKVFESVGIESSIIMSGVDYQLSTKCQIGSIFTYVRRLKLCEIDINKFYVKANLLLIDEAHHVLNKTYQTILKNYEDKFVIGFTATPTLSTGAGLGNFFDSMVDVVPIKELLDSGHLVPGRYYGPTVPDLDKLESVRGDYKPKDIDSVMNQPKLVGDIVENWLKIASDKQTMVFCINRKHGKALNNEFIKHGINSEYLDAHNADDERSEVIQRFRNGDTQIICQVALYTEGTDIVEIECLIDARPTRSLGFHRQKLGRGARPFRGKDSFIVIDHCGNVAGRKDSLGFYEDEIAWSLDGKSLSNKPKEPRVKEKRIMTCDYCSAAFVGKRCPDCGNEIKDYGKKVAALDAELVKIDKGEKIKTLSTQDKRRWYGMLEYERRRLKKTDKWLLVQYKSKTGVWPRNMDNVAPIEPDKEVSNWLKYQRIKWIKSKQKREAEAIA